MANIVRFGVVVTNFEENSRRFMEEDLASVGLDEHDMYAEPSLTPPPFGIPPGWAIASYKIPYYTPSGDILEGMFREKIKYRDDLTKVQLKQNRCGKYRGPPGPRLEALNLTTTEPYLYPFKGPSEVVYITEGEKKAAKVSNDWKVRAIGIGGKDSWGERDGSRVVHGKIIAAITASECRRVVIIADPDIILREDIRQAYTDFYFKLCGAFPELDVSLVVPPGDPVENIKIDDWLHAGPGIPEDLLPVEGIELDRGMETLAEEFDLIRRRTARGLGVVENNFFNAHALVSTHPTLKGAWRYNEDTNKIEYNGHEHDTGDILRVQRVVQRYLHMPTVGRHLIEDAVQMEALAHRYSPSYDEIAGIDHWDGKDRLSAAYWEMDEGGVAVIRAMVMGFVKRILFPGCHWRVMPILCGPNSVGKTGLADWLVGPNGQVYEIRKGQLSREDKDTVRYSMQAGILRIDDLDSFGGAEIGRLKAMVTARDSVIRIAYAKQDTTFKRRSIMMATTNHRFIIPDDPTGNTRFAAVWVGKKFNFDKLLEDRLQILVQARESVDAHYMPTDIDFAAMNEFRESSPMRHKLDDFLDDLREGSVKPDNISIFKGSKGIYFKAERFWLFYGKEPSVYDFKNFKQLAEEYKLEYFGKDRRVSLGGAQQKNVYLLPNLTPL